MMDIVIDTSALLAVIVNEPERGRVIELTTGHSLIGPGSIPWEVGNAFSAMLKRGQVTPERAARGVCVFDEIPIRYLRVDIAKAVAIAYRTRLYAYDAYFLECALRYGAPLLTLDRKLFEAARNQNVQVLEV